MALREQQHPNGHLAAAGYAVVSSSKLRPVAEPAALKGLMKEIVTKQCEIAVSSKKQLLAQAAGMRDLLAAQKMGLDQGEKQLQALLELLPLRVTSSPAMQRLRRSHDQVTALHELLTASLGKVESLHNEVQSLHLKETKEQMARLFQALQATSLPEKLATMLVEQRRLETMLAEEKSQRAAEVDELRRQLAAQPPLAQHFSSRLPKAEDLADAETALPPGWRPGSLASGEDSRRTESDAQSLRRLSQEPSRAASFSEAIRPCSAPERRATRTVDCPSVAKKIFDLEAELSHLIADVASREFRQGSTHTVWGSEEEWV